jgi:hypothetical protein
MISASSGRVRTTRLGVRDDLADELLGRVAHLGHGDADLAFSGLDRLRPRAVARALRFGCSLVPRSTKEGRHFFFDGALQDQSGTQPTQFGQVLAILA